MLDILDKLSYETKLGKNLKNTLRKFDKDELINEIKEYRRFLNKNIKLLSKYRYRIKAMQSILLKYDKYYPSKEVYSCFNDILGFKFIIDDYSEISIECDLIRIVDMTKGKRNDDGYRGIHLYYQKSKHHYPIEIQFFTQRDYIFNIWLHTYVYKYKDNAIGIKLKQMYDDGMINNEDEFKERLDYVLLNSEKI